MKSAFGDKAYSVTLWGTHPDLDNDDCMTGADFDTLEEAQEAFTNLEPHFGAAPGGMAYWSHTPFVMLDGPDVHQIRQRPGIKPYDPRRDEDEIRSEHAMQQGMAFGVEAYNEAMGWD